MLIENVRQLSPQERLLYWISEREGIRLKKEAGEPAPWTDDEILQTYRFTNVRRMDDKVSRWLYRYWYDPFFDHPNMIVAVALARFLNKIETLEYVGFPQRWNPDKIVEKLRKYRDDPKVNQGQAVFNAAYMVRGNSPERDKVHCVVHDYCHPLRGLQVETDTMQGAWRQIEACYGFGSFMAGQVVADLRWAMEGNWSDRMSWAPIGPGSKKGMNTYQGRDASAPLSQEQFLSELLDVWADVLPQLPTELAYRLELMDLQNCYCERLKYEKALWGTGKPKQLYRGGK